jgi:anti-sigma factor RsiW
MSDPRSFVRADELVQGLLGHLDERPCLSAQLLDQLVVGSLPVAEATEVNMHLTACLALPEHVRAAAEPARELGASRTSDGQLSLHAESARAAEPPGANG